MSIKKYINFKNYFTKPSLTKLSAICTEFQAAPFNKLSETTHKWKPFSTSKSLRIRPTNTSLLPTAICRHWIYLIILDHLVKQLLEHPLEDSSDPLQLHQPDQL